MNKILLDTNAYSSLLKGDQSILHVLEKSTIVYLSVFVIAELFMGFKGGNKETFNLELLERFMTKPSVKVIHTSTKTAQIFGELKSNLKKAGTPIPINDVWIASHALEFNARVITYDQHFSKVPNLNFGI